MALSEEIERIDREHARMYERDRVNERVQIWALFLTLTTVFGFIGSQNGEEAIIVGAFPFLVSCLARFVHDHQLGTDMNREYLFQQEEDAQCSSGAEHFFRNFRKKLRGKAFGGNKKALKEAFVVTSLAATYLMMTQLQQNHDAQWIIWVVGCFECISIARIVYWLTYWKPLIAWYKKVFHLPVKDRTIDNLEAE